MNILKEFEEADRAAATEKPAPEARAPEPQAGLPAREKERGTPEAS
jgi:hypothetical protein